MDFEFDNAARIYVGDLSEDATEHGLREHFSRYGDVLCVLLCRAEHYPGTRSYAYIWFSHASSADMSLQENNPVILGRPVRVLRPSEFGRHGIIHDDRDIGDGYEPEDTKIAVDRLPDNLTIEELVNHFQQFGAIADATISWPMRLGYVTYSEKESAENAMRTPSHTLKGIELEVKKAQPENEGNPEGSRRGERRIGGNTLRDFNHTRVYISRNDLPRFLTQNYHYGFPLPRYGTWENQSNAFQAPPPPPFPVANVVGDANRGNNSNENSSFGSAERRDEVPGSADYDASASGGDNTLRGVARSEVHINQNQSPRSYVYNYHYPYLPDGNGENERQGFQDPPHHDEAPSFSNPNEGQESQATPPFDVALAIANGIIGINSDESS